MKKLPSNLVDYYQVTWNPTSHLVYHFTLPLTWNAFSSQPLQAIHICYVFYSVQVNGDTSYVTRSVLICFWQNRRDIRETSLANCWNAFTCWPQQSKCLCVLQLYSIEMLVLLPKRPSSCAHLSRFIISNRMGSIKSVIAWSPYWSTACLTILKPKS